MTYIREHRRGDLVYYEELESYRDRQGRVQKRRIRWLGRTKRAPPEPVTITGVDFGELAFKMMEGSLTPDDVFELLSRIGKKPVPLPDLEAVGVRFDFFGKTLQVWLYPKASASKRHPRAPRAKAPGASRRPATGNDS